jgi:hypothetical protein
MGLSKKLGVLGFGSFAGVTLLAGLGSATASAEVEETAPAPYVTSRQATLISENAVRVGGDGQARGFLETRSGDPGIVHAQGEGVLVDTVKAVPGTTANGFDFELGGDGQFVYGPPIGSFGGDN